MTLEQFLLFMMVPVGGLIIGYVTVRLSQREADRFDRRRRTH